MIFNATTSIYNHNSDLFATILYNHPFLQFSQNIETERPNIFRLGIIDDSNLLQGDYRKPWYFSKIKHDYQY